jgi:hypothetical protein
MLPLRRPHTQVYLRTSAKLRCDMAEWLEVIAKLCDANAVACRMFLEVGKSVHLHA